MMAEKTGGARGGTRPPPRISGSHGFKVEGPEMDCERGGVLHEWPSRGGGVFQKWTPHQGAC